MCGKPCLHTCDVINSLPSCRSRFSHCSRLVHQFTAGGATIARTTSSTCSQTTAVRFTCEDVSIAHSISTACSMSLALLMGEGAVFTSVVSSSFQQGWWHSTNGGHCSCSIFTGSGSIIALSGLRTALSLSFAIRVYSVRAVTAGISVVILTVLRLFFSFLAMLSAYASLTHFRRYDLIMRKVAFHYMRTFMSHKAFSLFERLAFMRSCGTYSMLQ